MYKTPPEICYWCGCWNEAERGIGHKRCTDCRTPILPHVEHVLARHAVLQARLESVAVADELREALPSLIGDHTALAAERIEAARIEAVFAIHTGQVDDVARRYNVHGLGDHLRDALIAGMPHPDDRLRRMRRMPSLPPPGRDPALWRSEVNTWWGELGLARWNTPLLDLAAMEELAVALSHGSQEGIRSAAIRVRRIVCSGSWMHLEKPAVQLLARWEVWWNESADVIASSAHRVARLAASGRGGLNPPKVGFVAGVLATDSVDPAERIATVLGTDPPHPVDPQLVRDFVPRVASLLEQALTCADEPAVIGAALALTREDILIPRCSDHPLLREPTIRVLSRNRRGLATLSAWMRDPGMTSMVVDHLCGSVPELAETLIEVIPRLDQQRVDRVLDAMTPAVPFALRWRAVQAIDYIWQWNERTILLARTAEDQDVDTLVAPVRPDRLTFVLITLLRDGDFSAPRLLQLAVRLAERPDADLNDAPGIVQRLLARDASITDLMGFLTKPRPLLLAIMQLWVEQLHGRVPTRAQSVALVLDLERHLESTVHALGRTLRRRFGTDVPPDAAEVAELGPGLILRGSEGARYRAAVAAAGPQGLPDLGTLARQQRIPPIILLSSIEGWLASEPKPATLTMLQHLTAGMTPDDVASTIGCARGSFISALCLTKLAINSVGSEFGQTCIQALSQQVEGENWTRNRVYDALAASPDQDAARRVGTAIGWSPRPS